MPQTDILTSALAYVPDPSPFTSAQIESVLHNLPVNTASKWMEWLMIRSKPDSVQNLKSMFNGWLILARGLSFIEYSRKRSFQSEEAFFYYQQFIKCLWSAFLQVFSRSNRQLTSKVENEWACHDIKAVTDSSTSIFSSRKSCVFKFIFKYRRNSYHHLILISQSNQITLLLLNHIQEQSSASLWTSQYFLS